MSDEAKEWLSLADEIEQVGLRGFVAARKSIPELQGRRIVAALRLAAAHRS